MNKFKILILLSIFHFSLFAQQKFEKEYRIKSNEVPVKSLQVIKMWNFKKKVKWYAEESNDGKTFEAKVGYKKHRYSIEFSEQGEILDVEKTVKFTDLSKEIQQKIKQNLSRRFVKYKIKKVQIQYLGTETAIFNEVFRLEKLSNSVKINFEIILKAKKENTYALYEILVDDNGDVLKELKFKQESSLNLEF
ncbi:hypothetical protein [Polaribacter glomeratus]|uniref:Uncharacterized protein n=1 Tax=Polaribacter glomeratus TaxID=102 RepID=A0A2S7WII3_9FLAO|nr:hypothetical protein [Polaribacter glomeratus]PQJ77418.1 hypothetical protein BTO16_16455 [Polaribacter glomeratus]TXD66004.1 hypothetical protein ESX12_07550 [Polaribacter glomeratus]